MRRRKKPLNFANVVYVRYYYTNNYCQYCNCIFNRNGKCLKLKSEQGDEPRTFNKGCFLSSFKGKSPEEIKKYFRSDSYVIKRDLLPDHRIMEELSVPILFTKVKLKKVKDPTLVEVTFKTGDHEQLSTMFLRDLFSYELDNREREYKAEEERLGKYVDFDAIRRNHQPRDTA